MPVFREESFDIKNRAINVQLTHCTHKNVGSVLEFIA